jgi:hypothetical protein
MSSTPSGVDSPFPAIDDTFTIHNHSSPTTHPAHIFTQPDKQKLNSSSMYTTRPATKLSRTLVTSARALNGNNNGSMESVGETVKQAGQAFKVGTNT